MMARKYYDILQIKPDSSSEEIQHAYRKLALRYHPDRNPGPGAASQMAVINEAYQNLRDPPHQENIDKDAVPPSLEPARRDDLTSSILGAARAVILRSGWAVSHEDGSIVIFEAGNPRVRVALTDHLTGDSLRRITRQHRELASVMTVHIEGPIAVGSRMTVIDLMRSERHGALIPGEPCKSLLSRFL